MAATSTKSEAEVELTYKLAARKNEHGEWVVRGFCNGKRDRDLDAYEDTLEAARDTLRALRRQAEGYDAHETQAAGREAVRFSGR